MAKQYWLHSSIYLSIRRYNFKNIALGDEKLNINNDSFKNAVKLSQSEEFINKLPLKSETNVGEFGVRLSGDKDKELE